jgi:DNA-binding MarR family transcriptional regulator
VTHPRLSLDPVIHAPVRLSIVAALAAVDEADFASLRDGLQVSDSLLSKQSSALEEAGYVKIRKAFVGKRPRTYLSLTAQGRKALAVHLKALRELTGMASDQADTEASE